MKPLKLTIATLATAAVGAACAAPSAITARPTVGPATTYSSYVPAADPLPTPDQIHIGITILRKQCFGSAGCNITFRIEPHHSGVGVLHPRQPFMVIYEVTGGDSGPIINNFTVDTDGTAHVPGLQRVSTPSQGTVLTARAASVTTAN